MTKSEKIDIDMILAIVEDIRNEEGEGYAPTMRELFTHREQIKEGMEKDPEKMVALLIFMQDNLGTDKADREVSRMISRILRPFL